MHSLDPIGRRRPDGLRLLEQFVALWRRQRRGGNLRAALSRELARRLVEFLVEISRYRLLIV